MQPTCTAEGLPQPSYRWIRTLADGTEMMINETTTLSDGRQIVIDNFPFFGSFFSSLELTPTVASDTGNYTCVASNRLGSSVYGPYYTVYGKF